MISRVMTSLAAAGAILCTTSVLAGGYDAPEAGHFYISGNVGGGSFQSTNSNITVNPPGTASNSTISLVSKNSYNFAWGAALGWKFGGAPIRLDLAYLNYSAQLMGTSIGISGPVELRNNNIFTALGISNMGFIDLLVDLRDMFNGESMRFMHPYLGGGAGVSSNEFTNIRMTNYSPASSVGLSTGYRTDFAWRVMGGVAFPLTRNFMAFTQYTFLAPGKYQTGNAVKSVTGSGTGTVTSQANFPIYSNMLGAGLTYVF